MPNLQGKNRNSVGICCCNVNLVQFASLIMSDVEAEFEACLDGVGVGRSLPFMKESESCS